MKAGAAVRRSDTKRSASRTERARGQGGGRADGNIPVRLYKRSDRARGGEETKGLRTLGVH